MGCNVKTTNNKTTPSGQHETEETLKRKFLRWPTSYIRDERTEETGKKFWI